MKEVKLTLERLSDILEQAELIDGGETIDCITLDKDAELIVLTIVQ